MREVLYAGAPERSVTLSVPIGSFPHIEVEYHYDSSSAANVLAQSATVDFSEGTTNVPGHGTETARLRVSVGGEYGGTLVTVQFPYEAYVVNRIIGLKD